MTYTRREILEHRKLWFKALRSGTWEQVREYLVRSMENDGEGFCCMGIACVLSGVARHDFDFGEENFKDEESSSDTVMPTAVQDWLGVMDADPEVAMPSDARPPGSGYTVTLSQLNDTYGFTFEQIADAVEQYGFVAKHDQLELME